MVEQYNALVSAGVPREPAFPKSEYDTRLANVRQAMGEQDIDVLLVQHTPNFCYLAGFQTPLSNWYGCLIVPREGDLIAQVCDIEIPNLMVHGWDNTNIYTTPWYRQVEGPPQLARILEERGFGGKRLGLEARLPGCSALTLMQLQELLPQAHIQDASELVLHFRAVKSPAEVAHVRQAARLTDIGVIAGLEAIAPGKTDNDLLSAAYAAMADAGSEYTSIQPLVYAGPTTALTHVTAKRRTMKVGDTASIELSGVYQRYSAPVFRTGVVGEPSQLVKQMVEYTLAKMALLYENSRPGRAISDVAKSVTRGLKGLEGLQPAGTGAAERARGAWYGYSVGIGFPPDWVEHSIFIDEENDRPLEEGMLFHTPTGSRLLGIGAVTFSESMLITSTGCELLSKTPRELTVVPA